MQGLHDLPDLIEVSSFSEHTADLVEKGAIDEALVNILF
jgi:hypothetical protein